ncbi:MAG: hypothetical protein JWP91_29 [Fibrobacteres bacterium]|nr:hypothetical protein [Fibrobacterota bacterium]
MDSSENSIQPIRAGAGAERPAGTAVFAGTVTGVKREAGVQTLEVQYSQGKLRFQAEGDFQAGEKVRLSFPGNGSVQVEKGPVGGASEEMQASGYTLPGNMSTLKDLRAFEENVVQWMGSKQAGGGTGAGAAQDRAVQDRQAMMRLSLPQLMMQVMGKEGGRDFLAQNLPALHPGVVSALIAALQETDGGDAGAKASLIDLLKTLGKPQEVASSVPMHARGGRADNPGVFMPGEAGTGHDPWFGRIVDRRQADDFLTPRQRLQFSGTGAPPKGDPMFRYLVDMGGRNMEVFSSQAREPGEFVDFEMERHGGRMEARFSDPTASLPAGLKTAMAGSSAELRQGMLLASHFLKDFEAEPYYGKLVGDFGEVLSQSGAMEAKRADGKTGIPDRQDLDGLLKLFVAYPRDTDHPERQAKVWGEALKDPQAMMRLLKTIRPDQEAALLRSGTSLRLAGLGGFPADQDAMLAAAKAVLTGEAPAADTPEATAAWLKKALPSAFRAEDLLKLAGDANLAAPAAKDHDAVKFLIQAVANGFPREDQIQEGKPSQFYFYQGQEWRNLQVTWQREGGGEGRAKAGPKAPLQVRVETKAKHMGQVNVAVSWEPKGAKLDFRNQFHDVRDLLGKSLPELEKSLALLDFKVTAWTYEMLPHDAPGLPDPGWTRPASLSDGVNLDLFG